MHEKSMPLILPETSTGSLADLPGRLQEFDAVDRLVVWHPFDEETLRASRDVVAAGSARGRDAVHAATAILGGFTEIVSCDADFDHIPGLRRKHPEDLHRHR